MNWLWGKYLFLFERWRQSNIKNSEILWKNSSIKNQSKTKENKYMNFSKSKDGYMGKTGGSKRNSGKYAIYLYF